MGVSAGVGGALGVSPSPRIRGSTVRTTREASTAGPPRANLGGVGVGGRLMGASEGAEVGVGVSLGGL